MRLKEKSGSLLSLWTLLYTLFLFFAFIVYLPPTGYSSIVGPKHTLFLWSCGLFLPPLLLLGPFSRPRMPLGSFLLCLGFAAWILLSSLLSPYPDTVWLGSRRHEGFVTLALYMALFLAFALWNGERDLSVFAIAAACLLAFVLAAMQFAGRNPLGLYPRDYIFHDRNVLYSGEYLSTIGNSDLLSAFLTMAFLYLAGTYALGKGRILRPMCLAAAFFAWMTLLLSEVSAGPVGILAALAIALPVYLKLGGDLRRVCDLGAVLLLGAAAKAMLGYSYEDRVLTFFFRSGPLQWAMLFGAAVAVALRFLLPSEPKPMPRAAKSLLLVYLAVIVLVLVFLFFYNGSSETLQGLHLLVRGDPPDSLGSSRIQIWKEGVRLGLEKPLLGTGPDTYRFRSQIVFTSDAGGVFRTTNVDAAHNEYLNLWVCCGLPAALLFLGLIGSAVVPALRHPSFPSLRLLLPVLGYSVHAFFGISQSVASPLFYVFLGMLVWTNYNCKENEP